ncbi:MAG: hypothetical protein M3Y32_12925 [Pseudomonadota bacterium]|nr:hypothetical protein [Pseudomonadota bacterium]
MAGTAMYGARSVLDHGLGWLQRHGFDMPGTVLLISMGGALLYFVCNVALLTAIAHFKCSRWPAPQQLLAHFGWVGIVYAASATVACWLFLSFKQAGITVLMAAAPIMALTVVTLHYHFRQREAEKPSTAAGSKRPSARPGWPRPPCASCGPASSAFTVRSHLHRSAWPW